MRADDHVRPGPEEGSGPRRISSAGGQELIVLWFVALVFAALAGPLALGLLRPDFVSDLPGVPWTWVFWGFVAFAAWTVFEAARRTLAWRRWRGVALEPDPWPGSLGGHLGGSVVVPVPPSREHSFRVTVSCVRVEPRKGQQGSRWEKVVWTRTMEPRVEPAPRGLRLRFTVPVPRELPESDPAGEETGSEAFHKWTVRVFGAVPGVDLDQVYEVPVRRTDEPVQARDPALPPGGEEAAARDLPARVVRAEPIKEGTALIYPAGRTPAMGIMLVVFGAIFAAAPVVMLALVGRAPPLEQATGVEQLILGVVLTMGGAFGLVGLAILLAGLYTLLNSLEVRLGAETIISTRRILWVPFRSRIRVADVVRVSVSVEGQVGQGARAQVLYTIQAHGPSGSTVSLGDAVPGTDLVDRIGRVIREETGLAVTVETGDGGEGADESRAP